MIKSFLIDDELDNLQTLKYLLKEYCPNVDVIGWYTSPIKAKEEIYILKPDLIFLDIEMPEMNGFQFLENIRDYPISVIFTTAYHQYAIQAIKFSALDYLVKPLNKNELIQSIDRYLNHKHKISLDQFQYLIDRLAQKENAIQKLVIPNLDGFKLLNTFEIIYCKADGNYSHIFLKNNTKITSTRSIGDIQELLDDFGGFLRIHHSYLINYREVSQYIRGEGGYVKMSDNTEVLVSGNKKEILMKYINKDA